MTLLPLLLFFSISVSFSYKGLVEYRGKVYDCGYILGKYAHGGIPHPSEDQKVKLCCHLIRGLLSQGIYNALLEAHLKICRQLGR